MALQLAGFEHWEIAFDEDGKADPVSAVDTLLSEVPKKMITDLLVFSHGWNNDKVMARDLYERFFEEIKMVLEKPSTAVRPEVKIGTVGIFWPARIWADETTAIRIEGAASLGEAPSDKDLIRDLKTIFIKANQKSALDELAGLLGDQPKDEQALKRFHELMKTLSTGSDIADAPEDNGEAPGLLEDDPLSVFERFASLAPPPRVEGAAGLGDSFGRLWQGAKEALRQATYYTMKKRAGIVGKRGLGPLIGRLQQANSNLRVHLIGHSFGARLVSFSLAGLSDEVAAASPVKSLTLLQGAFSHFAFAEKLPHDTNRAGALYGMAKRIGGPIMVTHSKKDLAVGKYYPFASLAGRQDAADAEGPLYRWGAMGHDGAQGVEAFEHAIREAGFVYPFASGKFLNLDGNAIIRNGGPPSGAHSDIFYPEIAWAVSSAAGLAKAQG